MTSVSDSIWLSPCHPENSEMDFIQSAFAENKLTTSGSNILGFEEDVRSFLGTKKYITALNSGTSALHLALKLADVQAGDEVICQTFSFAATAFPILYEKAVPVFVDSEPETWNLSPEFLEIAIQDRLKKGKNVKAIIAVDGYGMPFKVDEIQRIAKKYNIKLIEDAAAALGSSYKEKKCGALGDFSIISFNGNKIITTSSGGVLVCPTQKQAQKVSYWATQSKAPTSFYHHTEAGYNYRMSNICAGIGRGQMQVLPNRIESRRKNYDFYKKLFQNHPFVSVHSEPSKAYFSNHWLSCILIKKHPEVNPKSLIDFFRTENIETRYLWKPLHLQPLFKDAPYYGNRLSEKLFRSGVCLPSGSSLSESDLSKISATFTKIFSR